MLNLSCHQLIMRRNNLLKFVRGTLQMQDPAVAVRVQGLVKSYAGMCKRVGCCHWKRIPPYHAVKVCWFVFAFINKKVHQQLGAQWAIGSKKNCVTYVRPILSDPIAAKRKSGFLCFGAMSNKRNQHLVDMVSMTTPVHSVWMTTCIKIPCCNVHHRAYGSTLRRTNFSAYLDPMVQERQQPSIVSLA